MALKNYDFSIETSSTGEHTVGFPGRYEDLKAPCVHEAKMKWISDSFQVVLEHIHLKQYIGRSGPYN